MAEDDLRRIAENLHWLATTITMGQKYNQRQVARMLRHAADILQHLDRAVTARRASISEADDG
jgi:hypothetical protein